MKNESNQEGSKRNRAESQSRHPSRSLDPRTRGYGIGGGYERPYRKSLQTPTARHDSYGPLPHSGYYGAGSDAGRFRHGQAGFNEELSWYGPQYGENTSGRDK
jgi:hypothetical protein